MNLDQKLTILFWVKSHKTNAHGKAPISMRITVNGRRAECSTGKQIDPNDWDRNSGAPTKTSIFYESFRESFLQLEAKAFKVFNVLLSESDDVTPEMLRERLMGKKTKPISLITLLKRYNEKLSDRVTLGTLSKSRSEKFLILTAKCEAFIKDEIKKGDIQVSELSADFMESFHGYLSQRVHNNTASDYCKKLKQALNDAVRRNIIDKNPFLHFRCTYRKTSRTFLTEQELRILSEKELSIERLEEVRDCYLFCCYTGYAYADASELTLENIKAGFDGSVWIIRDRKKSRTSENVPLLQQAKALIEKYRDHPHVVATNRLMPFNSSQRYNAYLKELADICGIQKMLTSHTARHTFATTVTLSNGVPIETVKELLGHTDIRTTQIYARIVDTKIARDMKDLEGRLSEKK